MIYLIPEQENNFPLIIKSDNLSLQLDFLSNLIDTKEDEIDIQLDKIDGRIPRQLNPQLYETFVCFLFFKY
jgi:hypothetical protein